MLRSDLHFEIGLDMHTLEFDDRTICMICGKQEECECKKQDHIPPPPPAKKPPKSQDSSYESSSSSVST